MRGPDPSEPPRLRAAFSLERPAFRLEVDLDLPANGLTALFGPSGSGKTTCLRVLAGLERARGFVRVGQDTWQDDERGIFVPTHKRAVGYVFQEPNLFPHLTVHGNLDYGRKRSRTPATSEHLRAVVDLLGIEHLLGRSPERLSGGERQRVAIARALAAGPRLLLMDEPMASLDPGRKAEILPYLERLRDAALIPVVYVTHTIDEVARLASHLALFEAGRILACGPTSETLTRLDLPTALFDDAGVVIDGRVGAHDMKDHLTRLDFSGASLWIGLVGTPLGASVKVRVLARDVSLARDPPGLSSILNVLEGRIHEIRDNGPDRVNVRLGIGGSDVSMLARITRRSRDALGLQPGLTVYAMVKSVALVA